MNIVAGYVLFNPDIERFKEGLEIVLSQFERVIVFDNVGDQEQLLCRYDRVTYLTEKANKGIAYGLNAIMTQARTNGYDWVVTLDQDTVIPHNTCVTFLKYINIKEVAIISPQVIDKRRLYINPNKSVEDVIDIDFCITSASCTNVAIWEKVGGFDDWLFIDFVDNDYCKRVKACGYRILQIPSLIIDQEFGKIELKSPWKVKFYLWLSRITHNTNVAKLTYKKSVSPLRVYYVHRNLLYLNKKFKESGGIGYENFYCKSFWGFFLYFSLPSIVRGQEKIKIMKAVIKGLRDGYKSKVDD